MNLKINIDNSVDVVDAEGSKIETIEKGISATLSGSNAFLNFDLLRHQIGANWAEASAANKIAMPMWEEITLTANQIGAGGVTLKKPAYGEIKFIYVMDANKKTTAYGYAAQASATKFTFATADGVTTVTLPIDGATAVCAVGDKVFVDYEYQVAEGFKFEKTANDRTKEHKFVALVIGHDICDKNTQYAAWQVFPRAKFSQEIDQNFSTDADHTFTLNLMQDYCDDEKMLFYFLFDGNAYNQ